MASVAYTKARYPNSGLRENTGRTSDTIPIEGRIRMYTSGCPKNQKMCCHRMALPPAVGSKKCPPKFRSMKAAASAAVNAGMDNNRSIEVVRKVHTKMGSRNMVMPGAGAGHDHV